MAEESTLISNNQATRTATATDTPLVSVVVCTRNRGESIVSTLDSLLASDYPNFEIVVIDQSTNDLTANAMTRYREDSRVRFFRSTTYGLGRARNIGMAKALSDIIVMTDDDCEVPPDWITIMAAGFDKHPQVAVVYCNVVAAPHDPKTGFVPDYVRQGEQLMTSIRDKCGPNGIGAGMAVRRSQVDTLGGFDDMLGPGAKFTAYDDVDMAMRALLRGYYVFETDRVAVVHFGFRTLAEGRDLTTRNYYGIGGGLGKLVKCGQWSALRLVAFVLWDAVIAPTFTHLIRLRRPPVLRRFIGFTRGFFHALRMPVDKARLQFRS
jgi:glycosyltransferase involved in cell wall biosynthesis